MKVVIIKYNAGNVYSVHAALQRLGIEAELSDDPEVIHNADKIIFPGVGEASTARAYLDEKNLSRLIVSLKQPVLGICLGLQLFCKQSEENDTTGLGVFDVEVKKFPATEKVPHMGWNTLEALNGPLFKNIEEGSHVYFVHSFYAEISGDTIARTNYSVPFSAALQRDNFFALQFHPEKSAKVGSKILKNFIDL
jgi:imidazole glycerol-phosphate synthase subunit HisH